MSNIYRLMLALVAILVIGFFAIKPYNDFCNLKGSCKALYWHSFFPKKHGFYRAKINFIALNYHENLEFEVVKPELITTFTNKVNIAEFRVKNLSQKLVNFRPILSVKPIEFEQYIDKYQCLCMQNFSIKSGEEKILKMVFSLNKEIEKNEMFNSYYQIDEEEMTKKTKEINIIYMIENSY